ncbi:unnamed protein product [Caenorhabditis angaria]|uniref:Nuclear transport factor 2 family protein n=1 Tax=Caenorhabditis angaria TaxID=860376 RepID=A0A9P1MYG1_9PELO|nr:unnamed protein product [Caenorhabditis angaria]
MKILIFFSLFLLVSSKPFAQQEAQKFIISLMKHRMLRDPEILYQDFEFHLPNGTIVHRDESSRIISQLDENEVKKKENPYKKFVNLSEEDWDVLYWPIHNANITLDGILEIEEYENNTLTKTWFAKKDEKIGEGYKLYRYFKL